VKLTLQRSIDIINFFQGRRAVGWAGMFFELKVFYSKLCGLGTSKFRRWLDERGKNLFPRLETEKRPALNCTKRYRFDFYTLHLRVPTSKREGSSAYNRVEFWDFFASDLRLRSRPNDGSKIHFKFKVLSGLDCLKECVLRNNAVGGAYRTRFNDRRQNSRL